MEEEFKEKKSFDWKKYLPFIGIAVAVILLIIILVAIFGGGPKRAVKKYIKAMNKQNASKVVDSIDFVGMKCWYEYDEDDFDKDDYEDFKDDYKDAKDDMDKDDLKDAQKELKDEIKDGFDTIKDNYKNYKIKVEKFKEVKKLGKDLYKVEAKISLEAKAKDKDDKDIDKSDTAVFIVYKGKLIDSEI